MQWSHNMVHSHFTLGLRARDYIKRLSQHPWYGLWMRVKGSHHYKVMCKVALTLALHADDRKLVSVG